MLLNFILVLLAKAVPVVPSLLEEISSQMAAANLGRDINNNLNFHRRLPMPRVPHVFPSVPVSSMKNDHVIPIESAAANLRDLLITHPKDIAAQWRPLGTMTPSAPILEDAVINEKLIADIAVSKDVLRRLGEVKAILHAVDKSGMNAHALEALSRLISINTEATHKEANHLLEVSLKTGL